MSTQIIGLDVETWLIDEVNPIPPLVCCTIAPTNDVKDLEIYKHDNIELEKRFKDILEQDTYLIAHNAKFDFCVLAVTFPDLIDLINSKYKEGRIICTKLYEKLIRLQHDGVIDAEEFALYNLVEKYLSLDIKSTKDEDSWRMRYKELKDVPLKEWPEDALDYAKKDALYCREVFLAQLKVKKIQDVKKQSYCDWLGEMTVKAEGLTVDHAFLEERLTYFQKVIDTQNEILVKWGFKEPTSSKDPTLKRNLKTIRSVIEQIYEEMEIPLPVTDKGRVKTDIETISLLEGKHEGVDALINMGSAEKNVSTYLLNWRNKDVIRPTLNILKLTGRMSCEKPNMQNLPREGRIRGCFIPRSKDYVFCSADYGQLELCTLSQVTHKMFSDVMECRMLEAINRGLDLHCVTGSVILGMNYEEFVDRKSKGDKEIKDIRQMSKAANFGLPGGLGIDKFIIYAKTQYGVSLTKDQAKKVFQAFFRAFPEVRRYLDTIDRFKISKDIGQFYQCEQLFTDRVRLVPESGYCAACNTFFQGLASDVVKEAFINLANETIFKQGCSTIINLPIHDEFIFELKRETAHEEAYRLSRIMIESAKKYLPDVKIIKAEPALMNRWEKEAEPTFDKDGRLIPWEPKNGL